MQPEESTWVTWDTAQTRSALGSEERIFVEQCQPKDLVRVLHGQRRGAPRAEQPALGPGHLDRSIVAVPFMTVARYYGIACHYIESAARVTGPSLSARILEHIPGVHCYGQSRSWHRGRRSWQYRGSVFDAFDSEDRVPRDQQGGGVARDEPLPVPPPGDRTARRSPGVGRGPLADRPDHLGRSGRAGSRPDVSGGPRPTPCARPTS